MRAMPVKQILFGLSRGLGWWFSLGLISGAGRLSSNWSKAGKSEGEELLNPRFL